MANKTIYFALLFFIVFGLVACGQRASEPGGKRSGTSEIPSDSQSPVFQLSTAPAVPVGSETDNWCREEYGPSLLINAEEINTNRRYFYLPAGVTKMMAGPSGSTATLLLQPMPNGNVTIFTGANFPECLSAPANLSTKGNGAVWRYNNQNNIEFQFDLQQESGRMKVTLELPPGSNYAMSVNHCPECR